MLLTRDDLMTQISIHSTSKKEAPLVVPGEGLGSAEEFLAGAETYEDDGEIFSTAFGSMAHDTQEHTVEVKPITKVPELKNGDIVLCTVQDIRHPLVHVSLLLREGPPTSDLNGVKGVIHVSKIKPGFISDIWGELRLVDVLLARVLSAAPSIQLSTYEEDLGVIRALCLNCRKPMERRGNRLVCTNCSRFESRWLSGRYGRYDGFWKDQHKYRH